VLPVIDDAEGAPMARETSTNTSKRGFRLLPWILVLVSVVVAIVVAWLAIRAPRGSGLLDTFPALLQELPRDEQRIGQIILDNYREYRGNARNWSAAYYGCLFLSAACAAIAGLVIKLDFFIKNEALKKDLAAGLAMISALLITLSTVGDFHQKWSANRLAAAKTERLAYAFITADRKAQLGAFSLQIQTISYERNEGIVSADSDRIKASEPEKEGGRSR
jgi:hypothetical protein